MTKKDFIVIANAIKALPKEMRIHVTPLISTHLKQAYPNFDPITFRNHIEDK